MDQYVNKARTVIMSCSEFHKDGLEVSLLKRQVRRGYQSGRSFYHLVSDSPYLCSPDLGQETFTMWPRPQLVPLFPHFYPASKIQLQVMDQLGTGNENIKVNNSWNAMKICLTYKCWCLYNYFISRINCTFVHNVSLRFTDTLFD